MQFIEEGELSMWHVCVAQVKVKASAALSGVRISLIKGGCTAKSNCLDYCHWKLFLIRQNRICPVEEVQERE